MSSKRIPLVLTGVAAWISLLLTITTTYAGSIVIGGNYTDIGTIVIVSPKPGDTPQNNGTALLNNLAGISADVNNPYLIKLGPGIYDIGTNSVQMKEYVDMEGSGENTTTITGHIDGLDAGVVSGASNAEIRFLTVRNTGGGDWAVAIYNASASPKMTHVTASVSGGTHNYGVRNLSSSPTMTHVTAFASGGTSGVGVGNNNSSPTMTHVIASASGGTQNIGVSNYSSSSTMTNTTPIMTDVTASASGGTYCHGVENNSSAPIMTNVTVSALGGIAHNYGVHSYNSGTIRINHSVIKGTTNTVYNDVGTMTFIGNTQLDGGDVFNDGTLTCVGTFNGNYVALNINCQ
jgi:hypothetical protein